MVRGRILALLLSLVVAVVALGSISQAKSPADPTRQPSAHHVIYINWDGFDYRYLDWANGPGGPGTPVLNDLIKHGVLFRNMHAGIPTITNPMQTTLVTGAWPAVTGNTYRYYDTEAGVVKQTGRDNAAETIAESVARQGLRSLSVQQFMLQDRGTTYTDPEHLYIQPGESFGRRVDELIKLLRGEPVDANGTPVTVPTLPEFIAIYGDDLDAVGHNEKAQPHLGYSTVAASSEERRARLIETLGQMDTALGRLVDALKEAGIYGRTAILLTGDHGMYEFTGTSSLPALVQAIGEAGFTAQVLGNKEKPAADTDLVLVTMGLQVQISWARPAQAAESARLETALRSLAGQPWFGGLYTREEIMARGAHPMFADFLVWPRDGYHFKTGGSHYVARGQHDTPESDHVPLLLWGAGVRKGLLIDEPAAAVDVAPTLARLLAIEPPIHATGRALGEALLGVEGAPGRNP